MGNRGILHDDQSRRWRRVDRERPRGLGLRGVWWVCAVFLQRHRRDDVHGDLDPSSGDSDLGVCTITPCGVNASPYVGFSVNFGLAVDSVTFTASYTGDYYVVVAGFIETSTYTLQVTSL